MSDVAVTPTTDPREPILTADDERAWARWMRTCRVHATTQHHRRRVDSARRLVDTALETAATPLVSWSGGKDSTVMTHLVCVDRGARHVTVMSEKDDLDYPGEREYVERLGAAWGLRLRIVEPAISPRQWLAEHAGHVGDDIHGRSAGLSKACFYGVVEQENAGHDLVALGLRTEESGIRRLLRAARGRSYELRDGTRRLLPIADWRGLDVYAYALAHDIELLPLYRCLAFAHADEPWRLRKSWWVPGNGAAYGQVAWLRRYYPSLYAQLVEWMPTARLAC